MLAVPGKSTAGLAKQGDRLVWKLKKGTQTDCQGKSDRGLLEENMVVQKAEMPARLFSSALCHPSDHGGRQATA